MRYYRYGKINMGDYCETWLAIAVLLFFAIASTILELSLLFVIFPTIYAIVWLWIVLSPHREQFVMCNDSITVYKGGKKYTILLPSELTLVVSYTDICPPLAIRTAVGNKTHILKNKYSISILQKMPLDFALEYLHRNGVKDYTTSIIRTVFEDYRYIYSFVYNQSLFNKLIADRECLLIIPESLLNSISVDLSVINMHIDTR